MTTDRRILMLHPADNLAVALVERAAGTALGGIGCEVNDIPGLLESLGKKEGERLRTLSIQEAGGTRAAIDAGNGDRPRADVMRGRGAPRNDAGGRHPAGPAMPVTTPQRDSPSPELLASRRPEQGRERR